MKESKICSVCRTSKPLTTDYWHKTGLTKKGTVKYKSWCKDCRNLVRNGLVKLEKRRAIKKAEHKCHNPTCNNLTTNPRFCSRSCSATVTNTEYVHRVAKPKPIKLPSTRLIAWGTITLGELKDRAKTNFSFHAWIREDARRLFKERNISRCYICGYSIVVEVCHIKPIKEFTLDTPIAIINCPENLIGLCPNHHAELDRGLLDLCLVGESNPNALKRL